MAEGLPASNVHFLHVFLGSIGSARLSVGKRTQMSKCLKYCTGIEI